eukprot:19596-Heterococcus_DN1.PRE.1
MALRTSVDARVHLSRYIPAAKGYSSDWIEPRKFSLRRGVSTQGAAATKSCQLQPLLTSAKALHKSGTGKCLGCCWEH